MELDDFFNNIFEDIEKNLPSIESSYIKFSFPEWPHSICRFPYEYSNQVPFVERFESEWRLFACNQELWESESDFSIYPATKDLFIRYRIDSLKIEVLTNQYWSDYVEYIKTLPFQQIDNSKPELSMNQIALKFVYEGLQITRENGNEIAKKYGHNSGEKLFQRFTFYSSAANRKGKPVPCTPKKLNNKIELIESIIELLPTDKQKRAKDEVSILKKIYDAEHQ